MSENDFERDPAHARHKALQHADGPLASSLFAQRRTDLRKGGYAAAKPYTDLCE